MLMWEPGGRPASSNISYIDHDAIIELKDGFHNTTLPRVAGPVAKLPPIAVKLNGLMAAIKPLTIKKLHLILP